MSKCTKCGASFVGTPENPPPDGLCKFCQIEELRAEVWKLRTDKAKLRVALVGLVGADTEEELQGMEILMQNSTHSTDDNYRDLGIGNMTTPQKKMFLAILREFGMPESAEALKHFIAE